MNEDVPPYISFVNTQLEAIERRFMEALERMASKDALELLRAELKAEREARETADASERAARETLTKQLAKDENDRQTRMRRLWSTLWAVTATLILAGSTLAGYVIPHVAGGGH